MKFLIVSLSDKSHHVAEHINGPGPTFYELSLITSKTIIDYANFHGYDYKILDHNPLEGKGISWGKVFLAKENIHNYDWVWCVDADLMIMNHTIRLENIVDDNYDVICTTDSQNNIQNLNTGSILYKNSTWTTNFLNQIFNDGEFDTNGYWEQDCIIKYYKYAPEIRHHFKFVHKRMINAFYHYWFLDENFRHGDFVIHLAGTDNKFRYDTFVEMEKHIIKPKKELNIKIWDK